MNFDAWGKRRNPTDWSHNNVETSFMFDRGYTGHEMLDAFGLINMNGRMYDPKLGRMLSPDILVQDAGNTQSYNRYSYCNNNPLMFTDPDGYHPRPSESGDYNSCYGGVLNWSNSLGGENNSHLFSNGTDFSNFCNAGGGENFGEWTGEPEEATVEPTFLYSYIKPLPAEDGVPGFEIVDVWDSDIEYENGPSRASADKNTNNTTMGEVMKNFNYGYTDAFIDLWNTRAIGKDVPDLITLDINIGSIPGYGKSMTYQINLFTRGQEPGFFITRTEQSRYGLEIDWGLNISIANYTGNPYDINKSTLLGPVQSVSGGYFYGGNIYRSLDSQTGKSLWYGGGSGIGLTVGGSFGWGKTFSSW